MTMLHMTDYLSGIDDLKVCNFLQAYSLKQGINKSGEKGIADAHNDMQQLHD